MKILLRWGVLGVCAALVAFFPTQARADFYFYFNGTFSGTAPSGPGPWTTALFQDVTPGTVNVTFSGGGLTAGEFVSDLFFNIDPSLNVTHLVFTETASTGSFNVTSIGQTEDGFQADGDGLYDIDIGFATAMAGRFIVGNSVTYQITGIATLTASSFIFGSTHAGGAGEYDAAEHVQGIGNDSGWAYPTNGASVVPEPAPIALLALGLMVWAGLGWFRAARPVAIQTGK